VCLRAWHKTRIQAADRLRETVLGKPVARVESHSTVDVKVDVRAKLAALLARADPPDEG
jgi:hypothetical protein